MHRRLLSAAFLLTLLASANVAAQSSEAIAKQLHGTWKLISVIREEVPSGAKTDLMGPNPEGFITYGPDGRMMVIITRSGRTKPAGNTPTSAEADALFRSVISYAGSYTIAGNELTHHVDISWNQAWTGTKQVRYAKFDGNRVSLSTPVSPDPVDGKVSVRSLIWEKIK
jgi:Lipocalin-like domain